MLRFRASPVGESLAQHPIASGGYLSNATIVRPDEVLSSFAETPVGLSEELGLQITTYCFGINRSQVRAKSILLLSTVF